MFIPLCERGKSVSEVICEGAIMFIPLCERGKSVSEVICEGAIMFIPLCKRGKRGGVQTGNIVYKIDRVHSLHIILYGKEVTYHAVENNKCYEPKDSAYCRLAIKKS